jgi:1,4-alpha-glucan branching enzyme
MASKSTEIKKRKIQFKFYAPDANNVSLVGDFNSWNPTKKQMKKNEKGEWLTRAVLAKGEYQYKYVVDGEWKNDPGASKYISNGMGSENSIRIV